MNGNYSDDGGAVGSALFDGGAVGGAVGEDGFVVVDVGDEDDDDGRRRVRRSVESAAGAVVDGRHVQFVLVPVSIQFHCFIRSLIRVGIDCSITMGIFLSNFYDIFIWKWAF